MKKRPSLTLLTLCMGLMLLPRTAWATAASEQKVDTATDLSFSYETNVYSISTESFVRKVSRNVSQDTCGQDEYITLCILVKNNSDATIVLHNPCVSIDGGEKKYWEDVPLTAGQTVQLHLYYVNAQVSLTPGLHSAVFYESNRQMYSCRFNISRQWIREFNLPTSEEIAACQTSKRAPYISSWLQIDGSTRYDAYSVDLKADFLPYGTYLSPANFYMDLSSLKKEYTSVKLEGISGYAGLQRHGPGEGYSSILSFWDIFCTDAEGNTTTIRAKRTYPAAKTDNDSFDHEGTGVHTLRPYNWQAGHWYRMLLLCGTSEETGNTTVEQWFMDLTTEKWFHACTYDTGVKNSCFIGSAAFFLENYLNTYAGEPRSMELTNIRIHTVSDKQWHDVTSTGNFNEETSALNGPGSWRAGADANSFYIITTGVTGKGTGVTFTIRNTEKEDPARGIPNE